MSDELKTGSKLVPSARQDQSALVVSVEGEVDLNNSTELRNVLLGLVGRISPKKLVLNLSRVPYMDSSAIAVLVELLRKMRGGKIFLADLQPRVRGLLEIARLNSIFSIVNSEQDALVQ
jgi:anti-anti-sigma factor